MIDPHQPVSGSDADGEATDQAPSPSGQPARKRREALSTLRRTSPANSTRPPTIYDVARAAGVSHQTVTRYLKGFEGIRPDTKERVRKALKQLDYRPNLTARSLTTGQSRRIGMLTHEAGQYGPSKIMQGATDAARAAGYLLDIVALDLGSPESISEALDLLQQHDLAGILAMASTDEMARAFESTQFSVPVFMGNEPDDATRSKASELTAVGFPALVGHLYGLGHRRFMHVAGPATWSAARNRLRAVKAALAEHGLEPACVILGDWSARSGYEAVKALHTDIGATAIIAANDQMALGAMLALTETGLRVPDDVSVTGVDDIPDAAFFRPPLTTLHVDFAAQGRAAVAELLGQISGTPPEETIALRAELIVRQSTGPVA